MRVCHLLCIFAALSVLAPISFGSKAARIAISLLEKPHGYRAVKVVSDTVTVPADIIVTASLGSAVFELEFLSHEKESAKLRYHIMTSGPGTRSFTGDYSIAFGTPVIVDSVLTKGQTIYRAGIEPIDLVDTMSDCEFTVGDTSIFRSDPSAHFEIFFSRGTVADYQWNSVRQYVEFEHKLLDTLCDFDDRRRVNLYLAPCESPTVRLDPATGFMLDPSKGNVVVLYEKDRRSDMATAFKLMEFYRNWGYAPRVIAEGIASFSDFNHYYVKEAAQNNFLPNPAGLFVSDSFALFSDRLLARRTAGSLIQYLRDRYGLPKFEQVYREATDLTVGEVLASVYGISADDLLSDWRNFLDTLQMDPKLFRYHSERLGARRDYAGALELLVKRMELMDHSQARDLSDMGNLCYLLGRYGEAEHYYGMRLQEPGLQAFDVVTYGNMAGLDGNLDVADSAYMAALRIDSVSAVARFKLGQICQFKGDTDSALMWYHLASVSERKEEDPVVIDAHLGIGEILQSRGEPDSAYLYFVSAVNGARQSMSGVEPVAMSYVRSGEGLVRIGEWKTATDDLNFALFIEDKPYYIGRAALAMGQAFDLKGDRSTALKYYKMAKNAPAGFIYSEMADRYISKPYSIKR